MSAALAIDLRAIIGAWRLARFEADGLALIDRSAAGAWRSFRAAAFVLPAHAALYWFHDLPPEAIDVVARLMVDLIGYVISWCAFPVVMINLSALLDRADRYSGFLAAYNWSAVVQMAVFLPVSLLADASWMPPTLGNGALMGVILALLTYQGYVARVTLGVGVPTAFGLVMVDLLVGAFINQSTAALSTIG